MMSHLGLGVSDREQRQLREQPPCPTDLLLPAQDLSKTSEFPLIPDPGETASNPTGITLRDPLLRKGVGHVFLVL